MKRQFLLSLAAMAAASSVLSAQNLDIFHEALFSDASEDGRYLVHFSEGNMVIYDAVTDSWNVFEAEYNEELDAYSPYFSVGFGNIFSKDNLMIGNYNEFTPAFYKDGVWTALPLREGDAQPGLFNNADGITADGKYIVGCVSHERMSLNASGVVLTPVLWERNANGQYGDYIDLPYPTKDFTGRTPQYVTARSISDDGTVIVGQVVDWSGFFPTPILYTKDASGNWTYHYFGHELIYDANAEFPEYPSYEPKYPYDTDYLSPEALQDYNDAMADYWQWVEDYWNGIVDEYPEYPYATDFMSEEDRAAYEAAMAQYQEDFAVYSDSVNVFNEVFYDENVVYGGQYEFNNIYLSRDGKYAATTFSMIDPESDPEDWWNVNILSNAYRFDLSKQDYPFEKSEGTNFLVTGLIGDGTMIVSDPTSSSTRNGSLIPVGTGKATPFYDYVRSVNPQAAQLMADELTFTMAERDENWQVVPGEEKVVTGTLKSNSDGSIFWGWMVNSFYGVDDFYYLSYRLTLDTVTGLRRLTPASEGISLTTDGSILLGTEATRLTVSDASGRTLFTTDSPTARTQVPGLTQGIYFITVLTADGKQMTQKVIRQ